MHRPANARRSGLVILAASVMLGLLWIVSNAVSAGAQATQPTVISVGSYEVATPGEPVHVAIIVDPGSTRIAALAGGVSYDASQLQFVGCQSDGFGTCGSTDGQVRFAALAPSGLATTTTIVSVEFDTTNLTAGTELVLSVDEVYDDSVGAVDELRVLDGAVALAAPAVETDGALTGDITDGASGAGVYGVEVCASAQAVETVCVVSNGWGAYRIDNLTSSTYQVTVVDPNGYYATATIAAVVVASPEVTTGVDAMLVADTTGVEPNPDPEPEPEPVVEVVELPPAADGGTIRGQITDVAKGQPVFGAEVCALQPLVLEPTCAFTQPDGTYALQGLANGNYQVTATDPARRFGEASSDYLGVVSGSTRSGIDLSLPAR